MSIRKGDTVRLTENYGRYKKGDTGVVRYLNRHATNSDFDLIVTDTFQCYARRMEKVPVASAHKYKVGQRMLHEAGGLCTITGLRENRNHPGDAYEVLFDGRTRSINALGQFMKPLPAPHTIEDEVKVARTYANALGDVLAAEATLNTVEHQLQHAKDELTHARATLTATPVPQGVVA